MATIVKGTTFTTTVTAGGMHALVESATISAITRTSMRITEASLASRQATAPTGASSREVWQTENTNGLGSYDATNSVWLGALPQIVRFVAVSAIAAGDLLVCSQSVSTPIGQIDAAPATLSGGNQVFGVALCAAAVGASGLAITRGPVKAATTGGVTAGNSVQQSSTAGKCQQIATPGTGYGFPVVGIALEGDSGGFVWISLRR